MSELEPDEEWTESYDGLVLDECDLVSPEDEDMLNGLFSKEGTLVRDLYQEGINAVLADPYDYFPSFF